MSGSSVGDSNHEYMRRNGVTKRMNKRGGETAQRIAAYPNAFERVTLREEAAGIIGLIMEINCEHAFIPLPHSLKIREPPCNSKKPV